MFYKVINTAIRHNGKYYEIGETVSFTSVPASLVNNLLLLDSPLVASLPKDESPLPSNSEQILSAASRETLPSVSDETTATPEKKIFSKKISKKKK